MTDSLDFVAAVRAESDALAAAAEAAGMDAPVPSCPDWKVADLLGHLGVVHRWAAANCDRSPGDPLIRSSDVSTAPDDPAARAEWMRESAGVLLDRFAAHDATDPCWTWAPPQAVGFWHRRMAHETVMHRVDAQLANGSVDPVEPPMAVDGIDEWLWIVQLRPWAPPPSGEGETLHFHCTDVDGEWLVRLRSDGMDVEREHAKGDVAARGTASDLLLWMMGRDAGERLEVFGDRGLLDRWRAAATF